MEVTRRDLLKLLAIAGAGVHGRSFAMPSVSQALAFEPLGNVTLLHMTDSHATLLPVTTVNPTLCSESARKRAARLT